MAGDTLRWDLLCAEDKLLLCCARTRIDPGTHARIDALTRDGIRWDYLLDVAARNCVQSLLYRSLDTTIPERVPNEVLSGLRERFFGNAVRNLGLAHELARVLRALDAAGVRAATFKGPAMAVSVFGNLGMRGFADLDILIPPEQFPAARDVLTSLGYEATLRLNKPQEVLLQKLEYATTFRPVGGGKWEIELHWALAPRCFGVPLERGPLWDHLETISLPGAPAVLTFGREDLLLYLCVHGAHHCWGGLELVCGVAELLRSSPFPNWRYVRDRAAALGIVRMVSLGVLLATELLGASAPDDVTARARQDAVAAAMARSVASRLFSSAYVFPGVFYTERFHARVREKTQDRLKWGGRRLTGLGIQDVTLAPLPPMLRALYYPLRFARQVRNVVGTAPPRR
jgi:hypothetical protein